MYVLSTGCQWRYVPKDLPPKSTLFDYFDLWNWDGTLDSVYPSCALCEVPGSHGSRSEPDGLYHRQPEREERRKRGHCIDPGGYDAGKSAPRRRMHLMEEDSVRTSCRLIWKLTSGMAGQPAGPKLRDKGRLGRSSDPAGCSASEVRAGLEKVESDADPSFARGRPRGREAIDTCTCSVCRGIGHGTLEW